MGPLVVKTGAYLAPPSRSGDPLLYRLFVGLAVVWRREALGFDCDWGRRVVSDTADLSVGMLTKREMVY